MPFLNSKLNKNKKMPTVCSNLKTLIGNVINMHHIY